MKQGLNIAANVCALIVGSIFFLAGIAIIGDDSVYEGVETLKEHKEIVTIVGLFIIFYNLALIIISSLAIAKKTKGLKITMVIMAGLFVIIAIIGDSIFFALMCLAAVVLEICSICAMDKEIEVIPTTDEKITELKRLKENGSITEEEYNNAFNTIINEIKA